MGRGDASKILWDCGGEGIGDLVGRWGGGRHWKFSGAAGLGGIGNSVRLKVGGGRVAGGVGYLVGAWDWVRHCRFSVAAGLGGIRDLVGKKEALKIQCGCGVGWRWGGARHWRYSGAVG